MSNVVKNLVSGKKTASRDCPSLRLAEGYDTYSDARRSGYGSARDYMSAVSAFYRSKREDERIGAREYYFWMSEWMTSMLLGYATEVDDPSVTWFATKWYKRKKKTGSRIVFGRILEEALGREKALSPEHRREILALLKELRAAWEAAPFADYWFAEAEYGQDGAKYEPRWLEQYRQKAKRFKPMDAHPVAPKTVVDSALAEKFSILDKLIGGEFEAASEAASEVKSVYEAGGTPSEAQLKRLRNMLYRSSMRSEADHFRVASQKSASVKEWMDWMALPLQTILKEHKDLVYGPVDDLVDEIFRKIAPEIVKAVGEREIDEGVEDFEAGAIEGRFEALAGDYADPEPGRSEDYREGYAWGFANAQSWNGKELPDSIERKVIREQIQWYRKNVTEQVVVDLLEKAWHAVSPMHTIKAMINAVKKHGWKLGIGFALFELLEHAVLPTVMIKLTGNPSMAILGTLPIGEIVYAVALRILGKADKNLDKLEEDGHLDWYESKYGPVKLASARRASCVRVARRYSSR